MIEQLHVDQPEGFSDLKGCGFVVNAGLQYSGWMVVRKNRIRSHAVECKADQEPNIDNAGFHAADVEDSPTDNLLAIIQEDDYELFL